MKVKTCLLAVVLVGMGSSFSWGGTPGSGKQTPSALEVPVLKPVCDRFDTSSTSIDLFGVYVVPSGNNGKSIDSSPGGGLALTRFANSYLGFSGGAYWWNDGDSAVTSAMGSVILRYPIRSACVAPYIIGGIGGHFNSVNQFTGNVGVGLEFYVPSLTSWGFFAEATYNWADKTQDYTVFRLGTRIPLF